MKDDICVRCKERPKWHHPENKYSYSYCRECHRAAGRQSTKSEEGNYWGSDEHLHALADKYRPKESAR